MQGTTGVNPGGDGGDVSPPPLFWVGGMACTNIPPLFEDKITLNLTFKSCKEIDLFNCKTIKNSKNRSLAPLARTQMYSETRSLRFCQFLDIIYVKKGAE